MTVLLACILIISVFGCSKKEPKPEDVIAESFSPGADQIDLLNEQIFSSANISSDRGDYLVGPGDLLEIKVFEAEKLNTTVRVSSRGIVSLPLVGEVTVKGLTAYEAESFIEDEYKKSYIKDPHISIFVKEHYSQRVTVIGQVKNPGTYDYPSKQKLLDALALAGGLSEKAGRTIQVRRLSAASQDTNQTLLVNLDKLINEGQTQLNIDINGGDIIFIPEAGLFYVDGAVRRPGEYYIKKTTTIKEAIFSAGGLEPFADPEKVKILRYCENGERKEIGINLEGDLEAINAMQVQDRDIIVVDSSFWGKVFYGSGLNIGIPGLGFNYRDPSR